MEPQGERRTPSPRPRSRASAQGSPVAALRRLVPRARFPGTRLGEGWRATVRGDVTAGVVVAAYLVPQCLAYARVAGLEPVSGLWAAFPALVVYALLGTSRVLSIGPESASAVLVASTVSSLARGGADPAELAAALALAVGLICAVAWLIRLGFLADLLSRPVLVGYLAGVAVTMIVSQLPTLTNIASTSDGTIGKARDVIRDVDRAESWPVLMGGAVIVALFVLGRFRRLPGPLIVVAAATAATALFDLENRGIETVGRIPGGLPSPALPSIPAELWPQVFASALGLALVAFSGNILTGRAFARDATDRLDADQELLALGGANAVAGLVGGFPVSSSDSRSALGLSAGASSQMSSLVTAACVIVVLLVAGPMLESFPQPALGGLVIYAGVRLVDIGEIRHIVAFRHSEAVIMTAAFAGVVVFDLLIGIAVAVALSVADLFRRIARAHDAILGRVPGIAGLHDIDDYPEATTVPGLVVYRYDAPLCFANADHVREQVLDAVAAEHHPVEWVLLNMEANVEIDLTALAMLEDLRVELGERDIVLALARVKQDLLVYLDRVGLTDRIGAERIFHTLPTALEGFEARRSGSG